MDGSTRYTEFFHVNPGKNDISLSLSGGNRNVPPGLYLIMIQTPKEIYSHKVVIY